VLRTAAAMIALAAVLLFGAAARMRTMGDGWAVEANRAIERYAFADRSLTRDMLSARIGLLRNYDMINQDLASADQSTERLSHLAGSDLPLRRAATKLDDRMRAAEAVAEAFKSENALLQNSLARVTALCNLLQDSPRAGTVSARFLRLTLDTSPPAVAAAQAALAGVSGARSDLESQLVAHGRLLIVLLPRVDAILDSVREGGRDGEVETVRRLIVEHERRIEARHQRAFLGLLAAGIAAVILWLGLLAALRVQARERRRRRENERLSATVASLLLEVSSEQLEQRIEDALQRLAAHAGATDAYLVLGGDQAGRTYIWSSDGRLSDNWPTRVAMAAQDTPLWENEVLHLTLPNGADTPLGAMLLARGTTSLLLLRASTPVPALLGFERHDTDRGRSDVIAGLRMAQAAILQALRRDGLERARLKLELRLARARRMEAIGAVASGVAHNFNNIIGAIGGFSEIAEIHAGRNQVVRKDLSEIRQAVDRARELVDEILAFGRGHDADYRPLALQALMEETVRLVQAAGRGTVRFTSQDWPETREVQGNATQLQQVFMNICNNAFLASPAKPHVEVTLELRCEGRPRRFSHGSLEAGDYAVVTIADRGCGIAAAAQPRLFEPFFTGRQGGTGLGLSTAWEIVQAHGGTIDVRSAPDQGSSFHIWLPVMRARLPEPVQHTAAPSGNGECVLVVAPVAVREGVEDVVAQLGYEPVSVDPARTDLAEQAEQAGADAVLLVDAPDAARRLLPAGQSSVKHGVLLLMRSASGRVFAPMPLPAPLDPTALAAALHTLNSAQTLQP
jgi:signal transduction histidine kinase